MTALLMFAVLQVLLTCTPGSTEPIVLFVMKDQSDTASLNPTRLQIAAQLALEQHMRETGSSRAVARHHFLTYTGPEENGVQRARDFIRNNTGVVALVGDINSTGTRLLANLASELEIPHVSFFATDESIFPENPWTFSYRERISHETESLIELVQEHARLDRPLLIVNDLQNLVTRWEAFSTQLGEASRHDVAVLEVPRERFDFTEDIERITQGEFNADGIVSFLTADQTEHLLQQLARADLELPVVLSGVLLDYENLRELSGYDFDVYTFAFEHTLGLLSGTDAYLNDFARRYRLATGIRRIDSLGPWIFDGMLLLHTCIEMEQTCDGLRDALLATDERRMVGPIRFDSTGALAERTFQLVQLVNGRLRTLEGDS